jgi:hypothetical protein
MSLQGIKIEYFITGGLSSIWLLPFYKYFTTNDYFLKKEVWIVLIPIIYIIGMLADFLGEKLTKRQKLSIKEKVYRSEMKGFGKFDDNYKIPSGHSILAKIAVFNKVLYDGLEIRITRDRILRAALVSFGVAIFSTFVAFFIEFFLFNLISFYHITIFVFLIIISFLTVHTWKRYQTHFYKYQINALKEYLLQK